MHKGHKNLLVAISVATILGLTIYAAVDASADIEKAGINPCVMGGTIFAGGSYARDPRTDLCFFSSKGRFTEVPCTSKVEEVIRQCGWDK